MNVPRLGGPGDIDPLAIVLLMGWGMGSRHDEDPKELCGLLISELAASFEIKKSTRA